MSNNLSKTFFVTGSARGLGRSLAEAILLAGHRLIATARQPEQLDDLTQRYGKNVLPLSLDVTDYTRAQAAMQQGAKHFGGLDVVINNAGGAVVGCASGQRHSFAVFNCVLNSEHAREQHGVDERSSEPG
jgi:NADP-dependent 3-hydroxy acid dehydrogenase YdfG